MKQKLLLKSMLLLFALIAGSSSVWADYEELYSANFTTVGDHSYTQNKTFTLSEKSWIASVSQVNAGVFYLGCNSNNAAKGILNSNNDFADVVTALAAADATYNTNKTTAHAYALLFNNAYNNVTKVSFDWIGTNNLFQVYLFGDSGTGWVKLANIQAANGASESGSLTWTGSATNYTKFAIVARPGASNSTATNKTLRASTFKIYKTKASSDPDIATTETSLTDFTYLVGNGPSAAQNFSVSGSNLTGNISLSLGESSNYEMSLTENSGYTNELSLTPTTGTVASTPIYVRLKSGLAANASYEGTVTLTSTGATNKAVNLAGSVTQPNFTWNLATNSYNASPTENQVTWTGTYATMVLDKASSTTNANNYLGGDANSRTSTRFYSKQILTITPTSGYTITSIEFTATTESYATALKNSTWTNATAAASEKTVTVTPTKGALPISATIGNTCGFDNVKVYYGIANSVTLTPAKTYTTLTSSHNLDFTSVSDDLKAYIATTISENKVQMTQVYKVPAGTGLVLKATTPESDVIVPVFDGTSPSDVSGNKMLGSATATTAVAANAGYILKEGVFQPALAGTLPAGKAYLKIDDAAPILSLGFDDATGIESIAKSQELTANGQYYNLNGQRVAQPTKGLYIVNGRKVVIK